MLRDGNVFEKILEKGVLNMFKFLFGLIWTAFVTPIFIICLVIPGEQRGGVDMNPLLFIFFILFEFIGLYMLINGLKKVIKDNKTEKHGMQCYGIIRAIRETGAYVNNNPEYKAILHILNPETNQIETVEEVIGFDCDEYPINSYVLCKYYQGDVNFEDIISENEVPGGIQTCLRPVQQKSNHSSIEFSPDKEHVTIDGIQYKKIK